MHMYVYTYVYEIIYVHLRVEGSMAAAHIAGFVCMSVCR